MRLRKGCWIRLELGLAGYPPVQSAAGAGSDVGSSGVSGKVASAGGERGNSASSL